MKKISSGRVWGSNPFQVRRSFIKKIGYLTLWLYSAIIYTIGITTHRQAVVRLEYHQRVFVRVCPPIQLGKHSGDAQ
jgi:hypothetical protein